MSNGVIDLRSALDLLKTLPNQLVETDVEVDPSAELAGVYRHVGAAGTVARPTQLGPAMMFNNVKGHPDAKVVIGVLSDRARVAHLLGTTPDKLGFLLRDSVKIRFSQSLLITVKQNARKLFIKQPIRGLIFAKSFRHLLIHRKMRAHILH